MAGEFVPLVMIPRYTSLIGQPTGGFTTIGMDTSDYSKAYVNTFMGPLAGASGAVTIAFQESTDQTNWTTCSGVSDTEDLTENGEVQYTPSLSKRWFRLRVTYASSSNSATFWSMGYLERRES